jgi:hypothetical protein
MLAVVAATGLLGLAAGQPSSSDGRLDQALRALWDEQFSAAQELAQDLAQSDAPDGARAWVIVAAARQRLGRHDDAAQAYRQFLAVCQDSGEKQYALRQIELCRQSSQPAPAAQAPSQGLSQEELARLAEVQEQISIETTEHFVVRAPNSALAKLVARQSESALAHICRDLLGEPDYPHSVEIFIWADQSAYRANAPGPSDQWAGGSFTLRQDQGRTIRRIDLMQLGQDRKFDAAMIDRVLPHEMCHLVLVEFFGQAHCPLALSEGLAMAAEPVANKANIVLAGAALAGQKKISLHDMLAARCCDAGNAAVFYAESYSLVNYLQCRLAPEAFKEMLQQLKAGCCLEEALQRAVCMPAEEGFLDRLGAAWENDAIRNAQFIQALETRSAL